MTRRAPIDGAAWITGASSGIGRALALELARRGIPLAISARSADGLRDVAREADAAAGGTGAAVTPMPLDVTDGEAVARTFANLEESLGHLALAVLNAGTHVPMSADTYSADTARTVMDINYMGVANALEVLIPRMIARGRGHIVVVSSVAGYRGLPTAAAYGPSKAALINLCESLKPELDRHGVRISVVNPGFVRTPLTDRNTFAMPAMVTAESAARLIVRGIEKGAFEITFPRRFTYWLKLGRCLPYGLYFRAAARMVKR